jgi:hypothetical protein
MTTLIWLSLGLTGSVCLLVSWWMAEEKIKCPTVGMTLLFILGIGLGFIATIAGVITLVVFGITCIDEGRCRWLEIPICQLWRRKK